MLKVLAHGRALRGTRLDLFGYAQVRQIERALADHYEAMVTELAANLTATSYDTALAAAAAADQVRGYEGVKLRNVQGYRDTLAALDLPPSVAILPIPDLSRQAPARRLGRDPWHGHKGAVSRRQAAAEQAERVPDEPQLG